ncbi:MAG: Uma2 family endonuclease [Verrucomicrobiaceae bacterium]|nr:Uma2 family endonuclease [Verrucomicrobiaceae bacterium]
MPATTNELPGPNQRLYRISVEFYNALGEMGMLDKNTELIRGIIIEKMSKSPLHANLADQIGQLISTQLPSGFFLRTDNPVTLRDSVPEPDIAVIAGRRRDFSAGHPTTASLVVEVAVTSLGDDRGLAAIYAEAGVVEYWIVVAAAKQIEAYRSPKDGAYQETRVYSMGETIECASVPGVNVKLDDLFELA